MVTKQSKLGIREAYYEPCPVRDGCICSTATDTERRDLLRLEEAWLGALGPGGGAYCISLQERPDRFAAACDEAHRGGLCRLLSFYRPRKSTPAERQRDGVSVEYAGPQGIWESHRAISKEARVRRHPRTLVLEDDFHFLETLKGITKVGVLCKGLPRGWDTLYLGHCPLYGLPVKGMFPSVFRTWSLLSHCYIMSAKGARKLSKCSYLDARERSRRPRILDGWMMHHFRCYAIYPQIAVQSPALGSDDAPPGSFTDRAGNLWLTFLARHTFLVETTAFSLPLIILSFIAILLALFAWRFKK
jgi:hypothetical protein